MTKWSLEIPSRLKRIADINSSQGSVTMRSGIASMFGGIRVGTERLGSVSGGFWAAEPDEGSGAKPPEALSPQKPCS